MIEDDARSQFMRLSVKLMARAEEAIDHGNDRLALEAIRNLGELARKFNPDDQTLSAQDVLNEARAVLEQVFSDELRCPACKGPLEPVKKPAPRKRAPRRSK